MAKRGSWSAMEAKVTPKRHSAPTGPQGKTEEMASVTGCEALFYPERARQMQELIETSTGQLCPCKQGMGCPLIGDVPSRDVTYTWPDIGVGRIVA